jgi:hypothetical protein
MSSNNDEYTQHLAEAVKTLSGKVDLVVATMAQLAINVAKVETRAELKSCPAPGACIGLMADQKATHDRLKALEDIVSEFRGIRKAAVFFGSGVAAAAGLLGALISNALPYLTK